MFGISLNLLVVINMKRYAVKVSTYDYEVTNHYDNYDDAYLAYCESIVEERGQVTLMKVGDDSG